MTEQWKELKETIIEMRDNNGTGTQHEVCKFLANLMDVLENQMSGSEIPNSSDCISRQAAIDALDKRFDSVPMEQTTEILLLRKDLRALPPVNPQPKIGHWILTSDDDYEYCTCSECGYQNGENWMIGSQIKFCQECGAKMESEDKG